jgi:hypothetical protein
MTTSQLIRHLPLNIITPVLLYLTTIQLILVQYRYGTSWCRLSGIVCFFGLSMRAGCRNGIRYCDTLRAVRGRIPSIEYRTTRSFDANSLLCTALSVSQILRCGFCKPQILRCKFCFWLHATNLSPQILRKKRVFRRLIAQSKPIENTLHCTHQTNYGRGKTGFAWQTKVPLMIPNIYINS